MTENTISSIVKDGLCTGCGTCIALCPEEAIKLTLDEKKGFYIPKIMEDKCNNCGICFEVCPGCEVDFKQLNLEIFGKEPEDILIGNYLNCYTGYSTDYNIRYNSSSGGLVTQLLIFALEEGIIDGALVTRMKKNNPLEPEPFIARTREEIIEASKSKYCPVPANIALKQIINSNEEEKFAVVGLPCHIHGIRKAEQVNKKLKKRIVLHLGLFCSSAKSFLATDFQLRRMRIRKEEVVKINYRGNGWPGGMMVKLENCQSFLNLFDYYDDQFCSFISWRCTMCIDQTSELADISFGDAWLPEIKKTDEMGTSIFVCRNDFAEEVIQQMVRKMIIKLSDMSLNKVQESQSWFKRKEYFTTRVNVSKWLFRKNIPRYNLIFPSRQASIYDHVIVIMTYLKYILAIKYKQWFLLDIYCSIIKHVRQKI